MQPRMVFSFILLITSAVAASVGPACLTNSTAHQLVENFITVTSGSKSFNRTIAEALFASDFSDTSGSVASIIDLAGTKPIPLLGPTFPNKTVFIDGNANGPNMPLTALQVYHTCNVVILRFEVRKKPQPILGISILETVAAPLRNLFPFQIKQAYGELDSAAWLVDAGVFVPANKTSSRR